MFFLLVADMVVWVHFAFALFAAAGAFLVVRWGKIAWAHVPAVLWAAYVELSGSVCPLTFLENRLRLKGGMPLYTGGFTDRYIAPLLYPPGLDRDLQAVLGALVLFINILIYRHIIARRL